MTLKIPRRRLLAQELGEPATLLLESAANSITRILPHTDVSRWTIARGCQGSSVSWDTSGHRKINVTIGIEAGGGHTLRCDVTRKIVPQGVGAIQRSLSLRELEICRTIITQLSNLFSASDAPSDQVFAVVSAIFDELVVAQPLKEQHDIEIDPEQFFIALRALAEQTYENHALAFGCIIDPARTQLPEAEARFPEDFLAAKRYRALSDAYYTSYLVSGRGAVVRFLDLRSEAKGVRAAPRNYFPEWCRDLALASRGRRVGLALTRNGDVLVFDDGTLRFTYRFGRW